MNNHRFIKPFAFVAVSALAPFVYAHGPQIQISRDAGTGRIVTREIVDTTRYHDGLDHLTDAKSVYIMPFLPPSPASSGSGVAWLSRPDQSVNNTTGLYNYGGPGISYQYDSAAGGNLAGTNWAHSGSSSLPNLQGSNFSFVLLSGLQYWNGVSFVDPGTEQLKLTRGSNSLVTTDTGPHGQIDFAAIAGYSASPHSTVNYSLLGDGVTDTSASDDGIYLLQLQLTSTAGGVAASDPFYYVFSKNASFADLSAAVDSLGFSPSAVQNVVPEPASMVVLGLGSLVALRRRRRA